MRPEFIFKDSRGHVLSPRDICNLNADCQIRAYAKSKKSKRVEKIGTYTKLELFMKFL